MNPITTKPTDKQKVLIEHGHGVEPAVYNGKEDRFDRYPNETDGDKCLFYYYSGVTGWLPFPEPSSSGKTFQAEPEKLPKAYFPIVDLTNGEVY